MQIFDKRNTETPFHRIENKNKYADRCDYHICEKKALQERHMYLCEEKLQEEGNIIAQL